jgi:hypothetical protein
VLGQNAYKISTTNQASLKVLAGDVRQLETDAKALLSAEQSDGDNIMALSTRVNKLHRNVTRAFKTADFELSGQLRSLENKLLDVKTRAVRKLGVTQMQGVEEIREAAQRELVTALMSAFKDQELLGSGELVNAALRPRWPDRSGNEQSDLITRHCHIAAGREGLPRITANVDQGRRCHDGDFEMVCLYDVRNVAPGGARPC